MKNLKKVLALVLAFACAFTMFAGAAFTDSADINDVNEEAVDTLVALGVIEGYQDGSFRPNDTVTRAEMAKMIYVIRTNRSDASAYNEDPTTFTDIGDHWARGYIKYCNSLGIIAGTSAQYFRPDETVTTQEAAKMLLVTLGYNAERAGLVGAGWAAKTIALADENGLLADVNAGSASACPRQYAAQLIYNAINAPTVVLRDGEYTNMKLVTGIGGDDYNETIGEKYMDLVIGTVQLTGVVKESGKDTYRVTVQYLPNEDRTQYTTFTKVDTDYSDLVGQKVKLLHKKDNSDMVYGIAAVSSVETASVILGDVDTFTTSATEIKADGVTYKLEDQAADMTIYANRADTAIKLGDLADGSETKVISGVTYSIDKASELTLIDNDEDGYFETIVATPTYVGKVTYMGSDSITVQSVGNEDLEDVVVSDDVAKDDYVAVIPAAYSASDKLEMTKLDTVEGTASATRDSGKEVRIDDVWYTAIDGSGITFNADSDYKLSVMNGYVYASDGKASTNPEDYVYVEKAAAGASLNSDKLVANLYFSDGTAKSNVVINSIDGTDVSNPGSEAAKILNKLCTFSEDNGEYDLDVIDAKGSFDAYDADVDKYDNKQLDAFEIDDDATIFVDAKDGVEVLTGAQVKGWGDKVYNATLGQALALERNGFNYVQIAAIKLGVDLPNASSDTLYGYLTDGVASRRENNTTWYDFTLWNGSETVTLTAKSSDVTGVSNMVKGDFISYETAGDNTINSVKEITTTDLSSGEPTVDQYYRVAIKGFDGSKIAFAGVPGTYDIDEDTFVMFVNTADTKGAQGEIGIAEDPNNSNNVLMNAIVCVDSDKDVTFIAVDVKGEMNGNMSVAK